MLVAAIENFDLSVDPPLSNFYHHAYITFLIR